MIPKDIGGALDIQKHVNPFREIKVSAAFANPGREWWDGWKCSGERQILTETVEIRKIP